MARPSEWLFTPEVRELFNQFTELFGVRIAFYESKSKHDNCYGEWACKNPTEFYFLSDMSKVYMAWGAGLFFRDGLNWVIQVQVIQPPKSKDL